MTALLATLLPALVPAAVDGVKGLINKWTGGVATPQTVDDVVKLGQLEIDRIKALAALDAPGANCSPWVADLRGSARYIAVGIILVWGVVIQLPAIHAAPETVLNAQQLMASAFSFLFGDRIYFNLKRRSGGK